LISPPCAAIHIHDDNKKKEEKREKKEKERREKGQRNNRKTGCGFFERVQIKTKKKNVYKAGDRDWGIKEGKRRKKKGKKGRKEKKKESEDKTRQS